MQRGRKAEAPSQELPTPHARVSVHLAASRSTAAVGEENYHGQGYDPSFDIDAWNAYHKYFSLDQEDGGEVGAGDRLSGGHGLPTNEGHRSTC